ncbi:MAG TPA: hypothetical protein VGM77_04665 [Gemmatimonadales bacterium]
MILSLLAAVALQQNPARAAVAPSHFYDREGFEQLDRRGTAAGRIQALCAHRTPLTINGLADQQDRLTTAKDRPAGGSLELGCTRALLYSINAPGRAGPEMPPGASWAGSALAELENRVEHHPDDMIAVEVLGLIAQEAMVVRLPAYQPAPLTGGTPDAIVNRDLPRIASLVYRSAQRAGASAMLLRSCASLMIDVADLEAAHDCDVRGLSAGSDSTWHFERLAFLAFLRADTTAGLAFFHAAERAANDSTSRAEIGWQLEPASRSCLGCYADGIVEPRTLFPAESPQAWLTRTERDSLFMIPIPTIGPWVRGISNQRDSLSYTGARRDSRIPLWMRPASGGVVAAVFHGSPEVAALTAHFWFTSYAGGAFVPCARQGLDPVPCAPSLVGDASHHIGFQADVHRLWNPRTEMPIDVVAFGIRKEDLVFPGRDSISILQVEIRRWGVGALSTDTSFLTAARRPKGGDNTRTFLGVVTLPGADAASWSVTVSDTEGLRRGNRSGDQVARPPSDSTDASDVILGSKEQGVIWHSGQKDVLVAPQDIFDRHKPVDLYYQVRRTASPVNATVAFAIRAADEGNDVPRPALLLVSTAQHLGHGVNEIQRQFDLSRLAAGNYELEVVTTLPEGAILHRIVTFTLE